VTSGAVRDADLRERSRVVTVGRPTWWAVAGALLVGVVVTFDLLGHGALERLDLRVSEIVSHWGLADSHAYPVVWLVTQIGGRVAILLFLAALVG